MRCEEGGMDGPREDGAACDVGQVLQVRMVRREMWGEKLSVGKRETTEKLALAALAPLDACFDETVDIAI